MTQVLQNLVINGLRYNRSPAPRVELTTRRGDGHYTIDIRDNGVGIEADYLAEIFKPLVRLHTAAEYPGTRAWPDARAQGRRGAEGDHLVRLPPGPRFGLPHSPARRCRRPEEAAQRRPQLTADRSRSVMDRYVIDTNIRHFERLLASVGAPRQRELIRSLLDAERLKLAGGAARAAETRRAVSGDRLRPRD